MKKLKLCLTALFTTLMLIINTTSAFAETKIGLVDVEKILNNYKQAKSAQEDLRANQEEIKKILAQAKKEIEKVKSDKEKEKLQKQFADKIMQKNQAFKTTFTHKWEAIQNNVFTSIKQVADQEGYSLVMDKQSVIAGGEDITDKVLSALK